MIKDTKKADLLAAIKALYRIRAHRDLFLSNGRETSADYNRELQRLEATAFERLLFAAETVVAVKRSS